MAPNLYDDPEFFRAYGGLRRSIDGLDGAPEWPALRALLPNPRGLRVLDLGCGYGWFCRWAGEHGARSVLGIDVSESMLLRAREWPNDSKITYLREEIEHARLAPASYDLAYSSLAFHYVQDLRGTFGTIHQALTPNGALVFSIEHPIYTASLHAEWIARGSDRSWPVDHYQMEGPRTTNWLGRSVIKQHRTVGSIINALIGAGFCITHVEDWGPTESQIAERPQLEEERDRPMFLLVSARPNR